MPKRSPRPTLHSSNGTRKPRSRTIALLAGIAHCSACDGRMYLAARKGYPYGDYVCRPISRGDVCPAPAGIRSDWLEAYTVGRYREATATDTAVSRECLLESGVRVTVAKGRCGGGPARLAGPDTSRLTFTIAGYIPAQLQP